jgi:hypothetical protein
MKKLILTTVLLAGLSTSVSVYAQGTVFFDNTGGGLVYVGADTSTPLAVDVNGQLLGGSPQTSIQTMVGVSGTAIDFGVFADPSGLSFQVPGTPVGTTAQLEVKLWLNPAYPDYAAALAGGDAVADSGIFSNPTGGDGTPAALGKTLTGMPEMHLLSNVPEPTTFALLGLGAGALLLFRRRK